jgi:hypothetical protein
MRRLLWAAGLSLSLLAWPLSARAQTPAPETATVVASEPANTPAVADPAGPQSSFTADSAFFAANNTPFASDNEAGGL